ncbi:AWS-like protein [Artemisia annua]|uniref:AWS-like protein n=1 Tax=Artemisia annua TaxID=35608 RepID=A0A2U1P0J2_ARTAN|nr:AWS-like protein [Artemisia annua]
MAIAAALVIVPIGVLFFVSGLIVNLIQAIIFVIVRPFSKSLFRRYTVDQFPLYDSAEDEPLDKVNKITDTTMQEASITVKTEYAGVNNGIEDNDNASFSESASGATVGNDKCVVEEKKNGGQHAMVVSGPSPIGEFNNGTGKASAKRGAKRNPNRKQKLSGRKQVNGKRVAQLFASKKVQDELIRCEEERNEATMKLDSVYDEIRPAIEERERDSLDSLPTNVAEKWIECLNNNPLQDLGTLCDTMTCSKF